MNDQENTMQQELSDLKRLLKMQAKEYLTLDEAAELYDLEADTLKKMVKDCSLRAYKCTNGKIYVRKGELNYAVFGEALMINELAALKF